MANFLKKLFSKAKNHGESVHPKSEMNKAFADLMASINHSGGVLYSSDGRIISGNNAQYSCSSCGKRYKESGQVSLNNRALGGALCKSCGNFYCELCVSDVLHSGNTPQIMKCKCEKSTAKIGSNGYVTMNNFKELVVFRAQ